MGGNSRSLRLFSKGPWGESSGAKTTATTSRIKITPGTTGHRLINAQNSTKTFFRVAPVRESNTSWDIDYYLLRVSDSRVDETVEHINHEIDKYE